MGPIAFPANRLEFKNPITRPSISEVKEEKTNGMIAAIMAAWSMRTATKLVIPGHTDSKNCKIVPRMPTVMINLWLVTLAANLQRKKVPVMAVAVYNITTSPADFIAMLSSIWNP